MESTSFSALERSSVIDQLQNESFDLLVIGGGITGAGIALDAATRGINVALVEKQDFAWGTSSRSTKLIHGGLRYLKQFEIGLVQEVGKERAIVHRNARHVVIPEKMLLPIVEGGTLGKTLSSIGLWVYDFLAKVEEDERRKMLSLKKTLKSEPLLRKDNLKGGGLYFEYRTDDARLTIEVMKTAVSSGATCLNYGEVVAFTYDNDMINGAKVRDPLTDQKFTIKAKKIVNSTGPWVDKLRHLDQGDNQVGREKKRLHLTKGVHIVVPKERLPIQQAVYFDNLEDGRMLFAIPRASITYIGTTDTNYKGDTNEPLANKEDVDYILKTTNYMFPTVNLVLEDVISSWAGLRPLIHEEGKDPSELSRKDEIFHSKSGLVSIAGGKLTGYRKMAQRVVYVIAEQLGITKKSRTKKMRLSGGQFESSKEFKAFQKKCFEQGASFGYSKSEVLSLIYKYGSNTTIILENANINIQNGTTSFSAIHLAELHYSIENEMTNNLCDYLIRRTGRLYFERPELEKLYPIVADEMARVFKWTAAQKKKEIKTFLSAYESVMNFGAVIQS